MFLTPGSRARQQSFASLLLRRFTKSQPHAPSDGVELFARRRAGRFMPAAIGPSNIPFDLQPYLGANKIGFTTASGAGSTTTTSIGIGAVSPSGTATGRSVSTSPLFLTTRRVGYVLASAAINLATGWSLNATSTFCFRGAATELGGFFFHARFGFAALTAGNRHLIGLTGSITTTVDPSTGLNIACIAKDAADTNFQVMTNDASGTATKIDTGIVPAVDKAYDVFIFAPPNSSSIKFALLSYDGTGQVDASFEYESFSDLPTTAALMGGRVLSGSGSATTGAQIDICQAYTETDF